MSESSLSDVDTMRIGLLTLHDSSDVPAGVADRNIIGGLGAMADAFDASDLRVKMALMELFKNPDSWGWNRLLPYDENVSDDGDLTLYESYLEKFYEANKHSVASAADAVMKCLQKENSLRSLWLSSKVRVIPCDAFLSDDIINFMLQLVGNKGGQLVYPFIADAAACIEAEAELMINWLTQGGSCGPKFREFALSRNIRQYALEVAKVEGHEWSSDTAAILLGIKKEAQWLCENMGRADFDAGISTMLRGYAFEFLSWIVGEYHLGSDTSEGSAEMTTKGDGNVDAAVEYAGHPVIAGCKAE